MADASLQKPNFSICYEPVNSLIRITWWGEVSEAELFQGYQAALVVLRQNPVQRILIDQSRRRLAMAENPNPMFEALFNEALKVIGSTLFLAMVVSAEEYFLSSGAGQFEDYEQMVNNFVIVERFKTRAEAEAWLASTN